MSLIRKHVAVLQAWACLALVQIPVVSSERRIICAMECGAAVQDQLRSLILVASERVYGASY